MTGARSPRWRRAGRSRPSARPRTCSSAPACSTGRGSTAPASGSGSPPTSAAAPAIRCSRRRPRATRCCSLAASPGRRRQAFYQMTLGNARALSLEHAIGSIEVGKDADLVVLDSRATPAMAHRMERVEGDLDQELFVLDHARRRPRRAADLRGGRAPEDVSIREALARLMRLCQGLEAFQRVECTKRSFCNSQPVA